MSSEKTVLPVRGMHCRSCARHIDEALRRVAGVTHVDVDIDAGEVRVDHDRARVSEDVLVATVAAAGYEVAW